MLSLIPHWLFLVNNLSIVIDLIIIIAVFRASRNIKSGHSKTAFWSFTIFNAIWLLLTTVLAKQGVFEPNETTLNPLVVVLLSGLLGSYFLFTKRKVFKMLLSAIPVSWLVIIQFFRVLGGVFLILYSQKLMPAEFAIPAGTGDVFIGVTSLFAAWALHNKKTWAPIVTRWWCYLGILDLILAITMGTLTIPSTYNHLLNLPFEPTNFLIGKYPLVMIPIFRVPFAITLHLLVLRKLNKEKIYASRAYRTSAGRNNTLITADAEISK